MQKQEICKAKTQLFKLVYEKRNIKNKENNKPKWKIKKINSKNKFFNREIALW